MNCLHILFSKDRALQLRAQLNSIKEFVSGDVEHVVLYHPSPEHEESYKQIVSEFPEIKFMRQTDFKQDVEALIHKLEAPYVFFTPDDGLFIRETNIDTMAKHEVIRDYIFSLRLGSHLTESHPVGRKAQPLPEFKSNDKGRLTFTWDGELDWKYPLALDGHIFDSKQILAFMCMVNYRTPTSLEVMLQNFVPLVFKKGMCDEKSHFVSIPWNIVTDEMNNLNAGIKTDVFLKAFNEGKNIKVDHIYGSLPIGCHQEYELEFV